MAGEQWFAMECASKLEGGCKNSISVRDFSFLTDEPEALGGTDSGSNPVEYVLAGLAGCTSITAHVVAGEMSLNIEEFDTKITGTIDVRGLMGQPGINPGIQKATVDVKIKTDASQAQVDALKEAVENRCPVAAMFKAANVDMEVNWVKL